MKNIYRWAALFILWLYTMGWVSHAFLGEEIGLNLYNILDEGYGELESKNFEYELSGTDDTIKEKINNLLELRMDFLWEDWDCIEKDLAPSHIEAIAKWNIQILYDKLWDKCKTETNSISIATISLIKEVITDHYNSALLLANEKSSQMQKIWSLWMYSDWILENASFDLIDDLEKIDDILFASKISYNWAEYESLKDSFDDIINEKRSKLQANTIDLWVINESITWETAVPQEIWWNSTNFLFDLNNSEYSNNYICRQENSDNWLNQEDLDNIFQSQNDSSNITSDSFSSTGNSNSSNSSSSSLNIKNSPENIFGNYKQINDNWSWPCSDFFCVTIDFQIHEQQLLWWWDNITLEYLLDRSSKHLRKFANSSLVWSQMTVNNWELSLKHLDLSSIFHMSFQIQTKPVPILSLKDEDKEDSNEFKSITLLEKYYEAYNLDYKRRNDIVVFEQQQSEYKSILNSAESSISSVVEKQAELEKYLLKSAKRADLITTNIYKKWSYETLGDFWNQFIELNNFTVAIKDYSENLLNIVKAMDKIPTQ